MNQENMKILLTGLKKLDVKFDIVEPCALIAFHDYVQAGNRDMNLTAITDEEEFVVKHLLDSASAIPYIRQGAKVLDIGTGAGFPAVPLAVLRSDISVTALDATEKKVEFVKSAIAALRLSNIEAVCGRAEEMTELFGKFDVVTARAVASLPVLLELAAPMLKVGGEFIAYKSGESELDSAKNAMSVLKMQHAATHALDIEGNSRALIVFKKTASTPAGYPRRYSAIKNSPL